MAALPPLAQPWTLLVAAAFAFLAAAVYGHVGRTLGRRRVSPGAELASRMFSLWWLGLAGSTAIAGAMAFGAALGSSDLALFVTLTQLNLLLVCAGLCGLLYYLLYLFTGRRGLLTPLAAIYAANYVLFVYFLALSQPVGLEVLPWQARVAYATPLRGPLFEALVALLVAPPILGALAYLSLLRRATDATQRYRITLVSASIVVWFGSALLATAAGLATEAWWQLLSRGLGLAAATTILMAYVPPGWARRRWGLTSVTEEPAVPAAAEDPSGPRKPGAPRAKA